MTRVFLAAGVAALAIAAPASAGPHNGGGGGKDRQAQVVRQSGGGGGGGQRAERATYSAPRVDRAQRFASFQPQRAERMQMRSEPRMAAQQQMRATRVEQRATAVEQARTTRATAQERIAARQQVRPTRVAPQERVAARQQVRTNPQTQTQTRVAQQIQTNRAQMQAQTRIAQRQQMQANRTRVQTQMAARQQMTQTAPLAQRQQLRAEASNLLVQRQALRADRIANADAFRASRFAALTTPAVTTRTVTRVVAPAQAVQFVGQPVSTVTSTVPLMALPASVNYLYPSTPDYYYQYGGGYLYQVDRSSSLISALIPLLAGGFLPGTYVPSSYMNSYVPNYYGLDSFYPSSYGYGYDGYNSNLCSRYGDGVIYQVDCITGMVVDVIPLYAGGYGVGQMLPSAYNYYNVPMQYRSMYYDTPDAGYWYAPGAIYQYDPSSSLITSVAALTSPGFAVGQPLPMGYDAYNVPYDYRATYYDTPTAMYRYNNGYIYQIDPTTQLVTAIVASLLHA